MCIVTLVAWQVMQKKHGFIPRGGSGTHNSDTQFSVDSVVSADVTAVMTDVHSFPIESRTNAAWNLASVRACWAELRPVGILPRSERDTMERLIRVAQEARLSPPHDGRTLLETVYTLALTNDADGCILDILSGVTNDQTADLLLWGVTNFHLAALDIPATNRMLRHWISSKSRESIASLRTIGTPGVISRLNTLLRQLCDEGHPIHEPGEVISPAAYPVEARDWLLNHPEPLVRYRMVGEWLMSGRPETPKLLYEWCRRIGSMPDDFYLWKGESDIVAAKKEIVNEILRQCKNYTAQHRRWMSDGQRLPFASGEYRDEESWNCYRKGQKTLQHGMD